MDFPGLGSLDRLVAISSDQAAEVRPGNPLDRTGVPETEAERTALDKTAKEFEGVFLNTLLKAMRQTVPENKLFNGGGATKFYRQMHDAEIARSLATGHAGMGIADMIVRQLSRDTGVEEGAVLRKSPAAGPPVPKALARYRDLDPAGPEAAARIRLTRLAASQGAVVADTLKTYGAEIDSAAGGSGLDPALILAVVMEESGGDPRARSDKGALGLMQLMPATAAELGVQNPSDPAQNLHGGSRYLADMLRRFAGRLDVALAAYNAGPGTVDRLGGKIPDYPATQRYVQRVMERYRQLGGGTHLASPNP